MVLNDKKRSIRKTTEKDIIVKVKSIGTDISYNLRLEDASNSGLLLSWKNNFSLPYLDTSILELSLDPPNDHFKRKVDLVGKVVRTDSTSDGKDLYGVKICVLEGDELNNWDEALTEVSNIFLQAS